MERFGRSLVLIKFGFLVAAVVVLSTVYVALWGGKSEKIMEIPELVIREDMTLAQFGKVNSLPNPVLKSVFGLKSKSDLQKPVSESGMSLEQIR